jgi:hypothetical protein
MQLPYRAHSGDAAAPDPRHALNHAGIAMIKFAAVATLLSLMLFASETSPAAERVHAHFKPGEKLTYELRWSFIPAGTATMEIMPLESREGDRVYHFVMEARSNKVIDLLYMVRDRIDAYADLALTRSVHYRKKQHEGRYHADITVTFDWAKNQAQFSDTGEMRDPVDLLPGSFDPLSAFYHIRGVHFGVGDEITVPITDGKKNITARAEVLRRETITVESGTWDTFLIRPDIKDVGGVFKKSPNAQILLWLSADALKIPIRIKSKVRVGSFIGELIATEGLAEPHFSKKTAD